MEADRFENLLRAVATRSSRRGFAGLLGGIALGGALGLEDQDDASAKNQRRRKRRKLRAKDPFTPSPILPKPRCTALNGACSTPQACCDWRPPGSICIVDATDPSNGVPCPPSGTCAPIAAQKGGKQCTPGTQCCRVEGATCTDDCKCCESLLCQNGLCGLPGACLPYGGYCSSSSECCDGYPCTDGRCRLD